MVCDVILLLAVLISFNLLWLFSVIFTSLMYWIHNNCLISEIVLFLGIILIHALTKITDCLAYTRVSYCWLVSINCQLNTYCILAIDVFFPNTDIESENIWPILRVSYTVGWCLLTVNTILTVSKNATEWDENNDDPYTIGVVGSLVSWH